MEARPGTKSPIPETTHAPMDHPAGGNLHPVPPRAGAGHGVDAAPLTPAGFRGMLGSGN